MNAEPVLGTRDAHHAEHELVELANTSRNRLLVALAIGVLVTPLAWLMQSNAAYPDFQYYHGVARLWASGVDPYTAPLGADRFLFPYPTLLALAPFTRLSVHAAGALFIGLASALLAYGITRETWHGLAIFLSVGFVTACGLGQWSPLLIAAVLLPPLAPLRVLKPSIGLALTVAFPSWLAIVGGAALLLLTVPLDPTWPTRWIDNVRGIPGHPAPVTLPGGILLLAALARWRRPDARLVVAMACIPQMMLFADQLPLWLVARSQNERRVLLWSGIAGLLAAMYFTRGRVLAFAAGPYVLASCYLPALVMVLRRPNEGALPPRLERALTRWRVPVWLRGTRAAQ